MTRTRRDFLKTAGALALPAGETSPPNIVFILADDLGYGDVSCLNPSSKIQTPTLDRLAKQGITFTDAHSPSAVCTPTRYGILTGRYCWRSRMKSQVLQGGSPPLIDARRLTVPALLRQRGYSTAGIGKWHLGLGWRSADGQPVGDLLEHADFTKPFADGPITRGFDYYYGISASLDMPPYTFLENDRVAELPTGTSEGAPFPRNWRPGPAAPGFRHQQVLRRLTERATGWIGEQRRRQPTQPFFLYLPLTAPHTPVLPREEFKERTGAGDYGALVAEVDWSVSQILNALDRADAARNTLLIVTSDNGPERQMEERKAEFGHFSAGRYRGHKRHLWDGGHRIPFLARWPGHIQPGSVTDELICLTDLMSTVAALMGAKLPDNAGEDSYNILPALLREKRRVPIREAVVHHSASGLFGIRQGEWKLLLSRTGDGPEPAAAGPPGQLYNMTSDPSETVNVYDRNPHVVRRLALLLEKYKVDGRSTPGKPQSAGPLE